MNSQHNSWRYEIAWSLALIAFGIVCRFWIDVPNFKPVAAIGFIAGLSIGRRWLALSTPLLVLAISDAGLAGYDAGVRLAVYGSLCFGCVAGMWLRHYMLQQHGLAPGIVRVAAVSVVGSCLFFLISNSAWWLGSGAYAATFSGWLACLGAGLPFFRATIAGDLYFSLGLYFAWIGSLYLSGVVRHWPAKTVPQPVATCD